MKNEIILYGTSSCHKTKYYQDYLKNKALSYTFHDVVLDKKQAEELKALYQSGKLNFPTLMLGKKRLRNPNDQELSKQLIKKGFLTKADVVIKYASNFVFTCGIDASRHDCGDAIEY
ncbi:MAG: hypothetical protein JKY48_05515 [Flavobacteriales bacterium]|nr:hypothetical protein [Flavobacteriales bacterium]